jgi:trk system potassium uptake protein TrkA
MSVKDMAMKYRPNVLVCTIERGEEAHIASGDFVFEERDVVSVIGTPKNANEFFKKIRYKGHSVKDALIVGGGTVTHYLCDILEKSGISLKVIEKDYDVCVEMAAKWGKVDVVHGNGNEREFLLEEGIETADAFVALAHNDEENLLLSLFAKEVGVKKLVTRINRTDYDDVISRLDLDTVVCPKNVTSDLILRYVRATKNAQGSNVETLYNIIQGKVEASEFIVKNGSPIVGKPLKDLKFKPNVLVAAILRGKTVIVPRGLDTIEVGDAVITITKDVTLEDVADVLQ